MESGININQCRSRNCFLALRFARDRLLHRSYFRASTLKVETKLVFRVQVSGAGAGTNPLKDFEPKHGVNVHALCYGEVRLYALSHHANGLGKAQLFDVLIRVRSQVPNPYLAAITLYAVSRATTGPSIYFQLDDSVGQESPATNATG